MQLNIFNKQQEMEKEGTAAKAMNAQIDREVEATQTVKKDIYAQ